MNIVDLVQATISSNKQTSTQAEEQLRQLREQNRGLFLLNCSEAFSKDSLEDKLRESCGVLIKYTVVSCSDGFEAMWLSVEHDIREKIKTNILAALASPKDSIRKRAAELIAYIYPIEHKHGRWEDLIPTLSKNMENSEMEVRKSAITALNQLCDNLKSDTITLSSGTLESLFRGIYCGLNDKGSIDVQIRAFSALESGLKLMKEMFEDKAVREKVQKAIIQAIQSDNLLLKIKGSECIVKFVEIHYTYLSEWTNTIIGVSEIFANSKEPELAIAMIKMWASIAAEEAKIKNSNSLDLYAPFKEQTIFMTSSVGSAIIPFFMQNLLDAEKYEDMDFEEEEFGDTETSTINNCIKTFLERAAAVIGLESFLRFVIGNGNLQNEDDVKQRAALITYSCMLSGFNDENVSMIPVFQSVLPTLMKQLKESKRFCLKIATAEALGKTAQVAPHLFLSNDTGGASLSAELVKDLESHPLVSRHIAKAWRYIGEEIANKSEKELKLDIDFDLIIKALITNATREGLEEINHPLIQDSLLAVKFLIESNDTSKYIPLLLEQLQLSKDIGYDERRMHIQSQFSSCLQDVIRKHQFEGFDSTAKESLQLAIDLIEKGNKAAGFRIIGALVSSLRSDSEEFFDKAWSHLETALQLYAQQDAFDAASECVSDWARACPQKIIDHLENILKNYLNTVNGDTCSNKARISAFTGITGIIIGCQEQIVPHVNKIGQIYGSLTSTASKWSNKGDSDSLKILREKILESYSEFFRVITQSSNSEAIFDSLPQVIEYLFRTSEWNYNPTANYGRAILSFVVDIVSRFGEKAKEYLSPDSIKRLMDALKNVTYPEASKDFKENKSALAHANQVFKEANFNGF